MDDQDFSSKITPYRCLTSCKKSKRSYDRLLRKSSDRRTDGRTDGRTNMGQSIGPTFKVGGSKKGGWAQEKIEPTLDKSRTFSSLWKCVPPLKKDEYLTKPSNIFLSNFLLATIFGACLLPGERFKYGPTKSPNKSQMWTEKAGIYIIGHFRTNQVFSPLPYLTVEYIAGLDIVERI